MFDLYDLLLVISFTSFLYLLYHGMISQQQSGKTAPVGSMSNMISVLICLGKNVLQFCAMVCNGILEQLIIIPFLFNSQRNCEIC